MATAVSSNRWAPRLARAALLMAMASVAAALLAAVGSGADWWSFMTGFAILRIAFFAAIAGVVLAVAALFMGRRNGWRANRPALIALLVAGLFVAYLMNQIANARSVPAIHDATTDLVDPPRFTKLALRADNLETIPDEGRAELAAMAPEERWKALHRRAYSDLRSVRLPTAVAATTERAAALAKARGWQVVSADPRSGVVEATATTRFFRFKDDIAVRIRPDPASGGSIVDMRSVSRVGTSDLGVNAGRIRAFLADLKQA
jgi:hypothetical protein